MISLATLEKARAEETVHETVAACLRVLEEAQELCLPRGFQPEVRLSWSLKRRYSRGGLNTGHKPFISLGMAAISESNLHPDIGSRFAEYKRINRDALIGGFVSTDWLDYYRCLTIHELAHAVQGHLHRVDSEQRAQMAKPHGPGWQRLYALLRGRLLNRKIAEQDGLFPLNWDLTFNAARMRVGAPLMVLADARGILHLSLAGSFQGVPDRRAGETFCRGSFRVLQQTSVPDTVPVSQVVCPKCLCALMAN